MSIFQSFLLGIVQGLTEFIPISSTAHLLIAEYLLKIPADNATFAFSVLVQVGTLSSLIVYFWKSLWSILRATLSSIKCIMKRDVGHLNVEARLGWYLVLATLPALLVGYALKDAVESLFKQPLLEAAIRLLITAIVLALAEWLGKHARELDSMTWLDALIVGAAQVISVFPGASRSGVTISSGILRGFDRKSAAHFAFLLSIPVMLAAGAYEILDVVKMPNLITFLPSLAVGFIVAAIVGWLAVKWLMSYLSKHSLNTFAIYCAVIGLVALGLQYL